MRPLVYSLGHSVRTLPEFEELLRSHGVRGIADVRAIPASGRQPWFNRQPLSAALRNKGIAYDWLGEELGGGREDVAGVSGLTDPAHRGYAAHMSTALFRTGVERLLELATRRPTAMMCAEASPASCHRRFLCDALSLQGVEVVHLPDAARSERHQPHPLLVALDGVPTYPPRQATLF